MVIIGIFYSMFIILLLCMWFCLSKLYELLKKYHHHTYESLHKPRLAFNTGKSDFAVLKFIFMSEYLKLNDKKITRLSRIYKFLLIVLFITVVMWKPIIKMAIEN